MDKICNILLNTRRLSKKKSFWTRNYLLKTIHYPLAKLEPNLNRKNSEDKNKERIGNSGDTNVTNMENSLLRYDS